jgi:hypothetical protein
MFCNEVSSAGTLRTTGVAGYPVQAGSGLPLKQHNDERKIGRLAL